MSLPGLLSQTIQPDMHAKTSQLSLDFCLFFHRTSACSFTGLLKPSTEIDGSYRLLHRHTRRVPRPEAKKGFTYREDFRRNLRYFWSIAYREGSSTPPSRTAMSPVVQHLEIYLRFAIPGNP
ncbi:hypothetical protein E3N88_18320 [Mikania micrantha]|uniref:Uncharacterized protein n=1 Tax=Mikania micrantha TaxID=192012 RepID=A0A5N6NUY7_9ASTR|nr:hypothetical protein E3N88_18320 [Mikania micrantha]